MKKQLTKYFKLHEIIIWTISVSTIIIFFLMFNRENYLTLAASVIGVTSIMLNAKGNPIGQLLMVIFSLIYGYISFSVKYYGEMITYVGMTMPMAVFALIAWLRHPFKGKKSEVTVNRLNKKEIFLIVPLTIIVTVIFYFILSYFNTSKIVPSTISVTTSFLAVYLTFRRSPYFSLAYAFNDIVLIVLWTMVSMDNTKYISV